MNLEPSVWLLILAAGTFISVLAGAGWKVFGAQLQCLKDDIERADKASILTAELLRHDHEVRDREVKDQLAKLVGGAEFVQFEKRVSALEAQINILQATRPTTGELKAEAAGLSARIALLESTVIKRNGGGDQFPTYP